MPFLKCIECKEALDDETVLKCLYCDNFVHATAPDSLKRKSKASTRKRRKCSSPVINVQKTRLHLTSTNWYSL